MTAVREQLQCILVLELNPQVWGSVWQEETEPSGQPFWQKGAKGAKSVPTGWKSLEVSGSLWESLGVGQVQPS